MKKMLDDAVLFAARAHFARRRKYTNLPYLGHCLAVMELVATVEHTEAMLVASVLHDVLERPGTAVEELVLIFGPEIAKMVVLLGEPTQGDRKTRLEFVAKRLATASAEVQSVKLAEIIVNAPSVGKYDPTLAQAYLPERRVLLGVLKKGNPELYRQASELLVSDPKLS